MDPARRRKVGVGLAVAVGTCLYTTGPLYRVRSWWGFEDPLAGDWFVIGVQIALGVLAATALALSGRWRQVDRRMALVAMVLVGWLVLGVLWSASPSTTLRESALIGVALVAGIGAAAVAGDRLLVAAAWVGVHVGLAWSAVLIALVRPNSQDANGEWTGVYFNPNSLALVAAFGILLGLVLLAMTLAPERSIGGGLRWMAAALVVASIVADLWLISGTDARTPLVGLVAALAAAAVAAAARRLVASERRRRFDARWVSGVAGLVLVGAGLIAWSTRGSWLSSIGQAGELTGRTAMWEVSLEWFAERPVVGHGYLGAWHDPDFQADMLVARGEVLGSTHNTFVEMLLGAGLVGFGLTVTLLALLWLAAGERALVSRGVVPVWPLAALVYVIAENVGETLFVGGQLMVAVTGALIVVSSAREPSPPASRPDEAGSLDAVGVERRG